MGKGFFGDFFKNDELLWFIILFLLLFFDRHCFDVRSSVVDG